MKGFKLLAAGLACCASTMSAAAVTVSHFETVQRLDIESPARAAQQKITADAPARVSFDAFGRTFDLRLEPNHQLLSVAARGALPGALAAYRGQIAGNGGSWSRIVIADGLPRGLIWDGTEMYAVEARADGKTGALTAIIYRLADIYVPPGSMSCGSMHATGTAADMYGDLVGELGDSVAKASGAIEQISIGAIGDYEFFQASGGSTAAILTRLNNVDGIFSEQLGVRIVVEEVTVFTSASDPFSDTADPVDLLEELAAYRFETPRQRNQGLTHLYTGRQLAGNTVGIAYTNTLCKASWGAGLTQSGGNVTFESLVAAHEIGHNFGAPHDGEAGSACAAQGGSFLMSTRINGSDRFSGCSIRQMQPKIQAASCIVPLPTIDPTIALSGSLPPVELGKSATVNFNVANAGSGEASGVIVEIVLPANVSLESAGVSQGTCTSGAGTVSCSIGSLPGASNRTVTITAAAVDVGNGELAASVSADADDEPANNETVVPLTVDPAGETPAEAVAPPASAGSGGGGVIALPWLMLLGLAGLSRRLRRRPPQPY